MAGHAARGRVFVGDDDSMVAGCRIVDEKGFERRISPLVNTGHRLVVCVSCSIGMAE